MSFVIILRIPSLKADIAGILQDWGFLWFMADGHLLDGVHHSTSTSRSEEFGGQHFSDKLHTSMGVFHLPEVEILMPFKSLFLK